MKRKEGNVFITDKRIALAFITQGAHLYGDFMKNINFRRPDVIRKLKAKKEELEIGDVVFISNYAFIVYKKHYNSKPKREDIKTIIQNNRNLLEELELKTVTNQKIELIIPLLKDLDIIIYETSKWEWGK